MQVYGVRQGAAAFAGKSLNKIAHRKARSFAEENLIFLCILSDISVNN